jgi:phage shock protein PspC (stress-responsive transcriptional regulator)/predicted membrane protein
MVACGRRGQDGLDANARSNDPTLRPAETPVNPSNDRDTRDTHDEGSAGSAWSPPPNPSSPPSPPPGTAGPVGPPPARPPLRRPREGRVLTGVGAGLALHLGIDVTVVRILIVVLTLVTNGLGLVAYLVAAVLIPADDGTAVAATRPRAGVDGNSAVGARDPLFWVGIGLLVLGALLLLTGPFAVDRWFPIALEPGVLLPLVLIGFGLALWRAGDRRERPQAFASPPAAATPVWTTTRPDTPAAPIPFAPATPATTTETPMATDQPRDPGGASAPTTPPPSTGTTEPHPPVPPAGGGAVPPVWSPPPVGGGRPPQGGGDAPAWTPPPAPERQSSLLGRLTFGLALVTVGLLWLLDISAPVTIGIGRLLAAGLLVLGLGLLVGAFAGRARWLILPAALLTPVVLLASVVTPIAWTNLDVRADGVGERIERPATVEDAASGYQLGAGSLRLDLTELALEDLEAAGTTTIAVQVGAGEVIVVVPDDVSVAATGRVGAGEVSLFRTTDSGLGVQRSDSFTPTGAPLDGDATIVLDVQVGFGTVEVRSVSPTTRPDPAGATEDAGTEDAPTEDATTDDATTDDATTDDATTDGEPLDDEPVDDAEAVASRLLTTLLTAGA